jgi:dihydropteroate synthase
MWAGMSLDRTRIMGVLNVTSDSFSDGGLHNDPEAAVDAGLAMAAAGADIVDVGGESTRPGAVPVPPDEEIRRIVPVIGALSAARVRVSADTRNAATMAAALDAGAVIINDISGLRYDPASRQLIAGRGCPVVLMHMRGVPATMNAEARYVDPVNEVLQELRPIISHALEAGIRASQIAIDPGIGFAKLADHSAAILRHLTEFTGMGYPVLVGVSRKSFIGRLSGARNPQSRLPGSLAAALFAVSQGAAILRVHDVSATVQALRVWHSLFRDSTASV